MWLVLLGGCELIFGGPRPMTTGDGFFDRPWPSDDRLVDGHPDMSDFPGVGEFDLVDKYTAIALELDGFGTNAPLYQRFESPLDTEALPDPDGSTSTEAALFLLDVDPASPERGRLVPFTWDYQETETNWQPEHLLAVQPVWGVPLRPKTRYALVFTTDIARPVKDFERVWEPDDPRHAYYQDLDETLFSLAVDLERVAWATVFTTQDTVGETAAIADYIHEDLATPALDQDLTLLTDARTFGAYRGTVWIPWFQHGNAPFVSEGGGFAFDEAGTPLLASWEPVDFVLSVPRTGEMPEEGWPVVIFMDGTGSDATTFANYPSEDEVAGVLAARGLAGFSISLPYHGDRNTGGDPELLSFNYANPTAGRTNFRQAALEQVYLVELLTGQSHAFVGEDGATARTDPDRVAYMGHSHGGEIGSLAVPFFGDRVRSVVLSGTGGGLSLSVVYRDAGDWDIQSLLTTTFDFAPDEVMDETHPLVGMVQLVSEVTDPLNYGPFWHAWEPAWETAPQSVLMFEGLRDVYTPPIATESLAAAARQPMLEPVSELSLAQEVLDIAIMGTPASGNVEAWDQSPVTAGLAQYETQGHFAVFDDDDARDLYAAFLQSGMEQLPRVEAR